MDRPRCFPRNIFSAQREFTEFKEPEQQQQMDLEECEPIMIDKQEILEQRDILKTKNQKQRERAIPGAKLLKKIHKQQRLEDSLHRVVKNLSIND